MWATPSRIDRPLIEMAKKLNCDWIGAVGVSPEVNSYRNNCHNNVQTHVEVYAGTPCIGYYFVYGFNVVQAVRHTVWNLNDSLIDITPHSNNTNHIIFARSTDQTSDYSIPNCYSHLLDKYIMQENEVMYYVYQLVDPRDNTPFYIGKGTGNRAHTHMRTIPDTRNQYKENKIAAIRAKGLEPEIRYVAENIIDEELAYNIERDMISYYGRKGYDTDGILTNICRDSRPPNHKGKSYDEIYGPTRAIEQRALRSRLQKERGGYGPKKHSAETRQKLRELSAGENNSMFGQRHTASAKLKMSQNAKLYFGATNKKSHKYCLTSPTGVEHVLYGGEASQFCKEHNLSWSTLKMQIHQDWPIPKKGKTKGWQLTTLQEK